MEKQDVMYVVAGLVIILVIALVIKPIVTGHPVNTGIASPTTRTTVPVTNLSSVATISHITTILTTPTATPTPVPTSTYGSGAVVTVGFVNPETYHLSLTPEIPNATQAANLPVTSSLTTIATISGQYSGVTQVINIPFPYWEMWYTVDPAGNGGKGQSLSQSVVVVGPSEGPPSKSGSSTSVIQGSYSVTYPSFSIQVMDAGDPNRIVRTIEPPGGVIDSSLWTTNDPRPWVEKFYEGQRGYYLIIRANSLNSYSIDFRVPTQYIGKY